MDPKRYEALKTRVEGACGISLTTTHIDTRYLLQSSRNVDTTASAHIVLFSLIPNAPGMPLFRGRWDDRASAVDVDLVGSLRQRLAFKRGLFGYSGHHTTQIATSPRRCSISIYIPGTRIFQGEIELGTKIGVRLEGVLALNDNVAVSVAVQKPSLFRRITRWLRKFFAPDS